MDHLPAGHGEFKCSPIIQAVSASALSSVEAEVNQDESTGLREGAQWRQAALRVAQLARNGQPALATCLEMHMCNSIWTPDRLIKLGYKYDDSDVQNTMCSFCGAETDSVHHRTYYCQATHDLLAHGEDGAQHAAPRALRTIEKAKEDIAAGQHLGLWLRGLIPTDMPPRVDKSVPKSQMTGNIVALTSTEFYSDGALGHYAQFPNLAVGGWGWCPIDDNNNVVVAECGTLEGDEQTVPRAELRAVLSILESPCWCKNHHKGRCLIPTGVSQRPRGQMPLRQRRYVA